MSPSVRVGGRNMISGDSIKRNVGIKWGLILGMPGASGLCLWPKVVAVSLPWAVWFHLFRARKVPIPLGPPVGPDW